MGIFEAKGFVHGIMLEKLTFRVRDRMPEANRRGGTTRVTKTELYLSPVVPGSGVDTADIVTDSAMACESCPVLGKGCSGLILFEQERAEVNYERALLLADYLFTQPKSGPWLKRLKMIFLLMYERGAKCVPEKREVLQQGDSVSSSEFFSVVPVAPRKNTRIQEP